jgi:ribosomal protein L29
MKLKKYRKMTIRKLRKELEKAQKELSELQFDIRVGKAKDYDSIRQQKKEVARILTVLNEEEDQQIMPAREKDVSKKQGTKQKERKDSKEVEKRRRGKIKRKRKE